MGALPAPGKMTEEMTPMRMHSVDRATCLCPDIGFAPRPTDVPTTELPMCFTPEALDIIRRTVASRRPETGAKGFGPVDRIGFDVVEYDVRGSSSAHAAVYSPDVEWGSERQRFWMDRPSEHLRLWTGDIHSHPGDFGRPSRRAGPGLGDLGYVEAVFEANETMQFFFIPILTGVGTGRMATLHPWIVSRDTPTEPMWAEALVCRVDVFPPRVFNPEWEARQAASSVEAAAPAWAYDIARLVDLVGAQVRKEPVVDNGVTLIRLEVRGRSIDVSLPVGFPHAPPYLTTDIGDNRSVGVPFVWNPESIGIEPERRLADLVRDTAAWLERSY